MVHGSIADHTTFDPFIAVLRNHFTTFAMDRRGFGATPDTGDYTIDVDFADVAAVVDAVAAPHRRAGRPVGPLLRGQLRDRRRRPHRQGQPPHPLRTEPRSSLSARLDRGIEAALANGDHDAAIVAVLVDILEMTDEEVDALRQARCGVRVGGGAHHPEGVPRRGGLGLPTGPVRRHHRTHPLAQGSDSVPGIVEATERAAAAIPGARIQLLDGHGHFAHKTDPAMVTALIRNFVAFDSPSSTKFEAHMPCSGHMRLRRVQAEGPKGRPAHPWTMALPKPVPVIAGVVPSSAAPQLTS